MNEYTIYFTDQSGERRSVKLMASGYVDATRILRKNYKVREIERIEASKK